MSVIDDVVALIDRDELVRFALEICNIDSAVGHEGEIGKYLYEWMLQQGFSARKIGLLSDRFNVLGTLPGTGGGYSLIFNSHMDTAVPRQTDLVHADPTHRVPQRVEGRRSADRRRRLQRQGSHGSVSYRGQGHQKFGASA